ncbi:MAG: prepilin-type N-terminal cleavage/methylation domain-containing protein [Cryobacterium sp.]|nr:prepilin-type N-terminal cleavage/methylation domain-containing protein [Cryobacterium sp.]
MAKQKFHSGRVFDDAGMTLVELLVYMVLAVVVLLIVGGLLINSLSSERTVRNATQASNTGQLVAQSVAQGVRNASALKIRTPSFGGELLTVRTASRTNPQTWSCQAWYFGAGEVRTTKSTALIPTTTAASITNWTLLGTGIQNVLGGAVFSSAPAMNPREVILNFDVSTVNGQPVRISSSSTSLQPLPVPVPVTGLVGLPCF